MQPTRYPLRRESGQNAWRRNAPMVGARFRRVLTRPSASGTWYTAQIIRVLARR